MEPSTQIPPPYASPPPPPLPPSPASPKIQMSHRIRHCRHWLHRRREQPHGLPVRDWIKLGSPYFKVYPAMGSRTSPASASTCRWTICGCRFCSFAPVQGAAQDNPLVVDEQTTSAGSRPATGSRSRPAGTAGLAVRWTSASGRWGSASPSSTYSQARVPPASGSQKPSTACRMETGHPRRVRAPGTASPLPAPCRLGLLPGDGRRPPGGAGRAEQGLGGVHRGAAAGRPAAGWSCIVQRAVRRGKRRDGTSGSTKQFCDMPFPCFGAMETRGGGRCTSNTSGGRTSGCCRAQKVTFVRQATVRPDLPAPPWRRVGYRVE